MKQLAYFYYTTGTRDGFEERLWGMYKRKAAPGCHAEVAAFRFWQRIAEAKGERRVEKHRKGGFRKPRKPPFDYSTSTGRYEPPSEVKHWIEGSTCYPQLFEITISIPLSGSETVIVSSLWSGTT
jgi:hypothetical protein